MTEHKLRRRPLMWTERSHIVREAPVQPQYSPHAQPQSLLEENVTSLARPNVADAGSGTKNCRVGYTYGALWRVDDVGRPTSWLILLSGSMGRWQRCKTSSLYRLRLPLAVRFHLSSDHEAVQLPCLYLLRLTFRHRTIVALQRHHLALFPLLEHIAIKRLETGITQPHQFLGRLSEVLSLLESVPALIHLLLQRCHGGHAHLTSACLHTAQSS